MKKCQNCKQQFEPRFNTLEKFCWNHECKTIDALQKLEKINKNKSREWSQQKKRIQNSLKTSSNWKNELQKIFNLFIRLRDKNQPCISCGKKLPEKYDAGHFHSVGSSPSLRFDERNVHAQCVHCNRDKHGNVHEYRIGLIQRVGIDIVNDLEKNRHVPSHLSTPEIIDFIELYKIKIKKMKNN